MRWGSRGCVCFACDDTRCHRTRPRSIPSLRTRRWSTCCLLRASTSPQPPGVPSYNQLLVEDLLFPVFIFVLDLNILPEEWEALRENILRSLEWLPARSLIGCITITTHAEVWELGGSVLRKSYAVRGEKRYSPAERNTILQLSDTRPARGRFLVPLHSCKEYLTEILLNTTAYRGAHRASTRPFWPIGTAVELGLVLLENLDGCARRAQGIKTNTIPSRVHGKLMLFTSRPCTRGPGLIVSTDKNEMIRFKTDIVSNDAVHYKSAVEFYNELEKRFIAVCCAYDVFMMSLDQVGVMEMRNCINNTGGVLVNGEQFTAETFSNSFRRYFQRCDLKNNDNNNDNQPAVDDYSAKSGFGAQLEVFTSANTLISGVLGTCVPDTFANSIKPSRASSPLQIGIGGTTRWAVSSLDQATSYSYVFDTATLSEKEANEPHFQNDNPQKTRRYFQFVTRYTTSSGQMRLRVTTVTQQVAPTTAPASYYTEHNTFGQLCSAVVVARMAMSILEKYPAKSDDTKRWLDKLLVCFIKRYGSFSPNVPESLRLADGISLFPNFMFNLRRSEYFMDLNISPDESTFKQHWLMREPVNTCVLMFQPTLDAYDFEAPYATPVPLDSQSLRNDNIVLMDAFFNIHIMWGSVIYEWMKQGLHEQPEYQHFASLLDAVEADAQALLAARFPYPRFSRTDADGSEARHIKTRVNPSTQYQATPAANTYGQHRPVVAQQDGEDTSSMIYTEVELFFKIYRSAEDRGGDGRAA
ncbi:protein transport protein SEC23 [Angomonas deanei]|uniref:Protein transport protein SEC23 n=1 Tax=Angomonas deanei TaxID=59799 RepID=A0A7G2CUF1_9TRYP|nr:protein transport protein SEC23 [Angomonas deanei]CAD2222929.1 Sec23/Sec24 trunk domain/Sec23/Sec24 beta-sandwich domain/Sec23/Sec24 helical domain/Gelsolin repeat, putative [Angomonas deanei]|eukprot:EPY39463.1 protein transport protein SEC23 [Angomonas deanei]